MLENNMASNLHLRQGKSETNFDSALTDPDSDLAKEMLRDPYDFSFLAMDDKYREEEYALESSALPIGVSDYVLERFIPAEFKSQMPSIEEVEGELTRRMEIAEVRNRARGNR